MEWISAIWNRFERTPLGSFFTFVVSIRLKNECRLTVE